MLFERIFKEFYKVGLNYAVIGGIAVNLHGYNRLTGDLDIVISLNEKEIGKFIKIAKKFGLVPRLPVALEDLLDKAKRKEWIETKGMMVFSVGNPDNPLEHIDVKIDKPGHIETLLKNSLLLDMGSVKIRVVSLADLIGLKKSAGRNRDLIDVKALQQIEKFHEEK